MSKAARERLLAANWWHREVRKKNWGKAEAAKKKQAAEDILPAQ